MKTGGACFPHTRIPWVPFSGRERPSLKIVLHQSLGAKIVHKFLILVISIEGIFSVYYYARCTLCQNTLIYCNNILVGA